MVVHELAHQWFGDSVALAEWRHIWLNEGFAQYAEWMWSEEQGLGTAQEQFDAVYSIPADDILHAWTTRKAGGNGTIPQFIRLAERVSGQQLDDLFRVWLFTGSKPVLEPAATAQATAAASSAAATLERARGTGGLRR